MFFISIVDHDTVDKDLVVWIINLIAYITLSSVVFSLNWESFVFSYILSIIMLNKYLISSFDYDPYVLIPITFSLTVMMTKFIYDYEYSQKEMYIKLIELQ